ncbi:uncharacterized protein [Hyperolius riggenbachi]|uniref:uncharacterized protein n=1 Tax=Hyperolius riggenbachi TaxID=752182 RepID=UPI0035A2C0EB
MYRAYQPTVPTANIYLQEKWDRSRYTEHRRKVAMAVPAVDTKGSQAPAHLLVNMKRIQMNRDLHARIHKQNHIHFAKLNSIRQSHGRLDNWNYYPQLSLHAGQRQQNLRRITQENEKILERIMKRDSEYGRWESDWEKVERIRAHISRYPRLARPARAACHRVTFMDMKRSVNLQNLAEESEMGSTHTRPVLDPKPTESQGKIDKLSFHSDKAKLTAAEAEKSMDTLSRASSRCESRQGSAQKLHKKSALSSAASVMSDHVPHNRSKSRDQKYSSSDSDSDSSVDVSTGRSSLSKEGQEDAINEDSPVKEKSALSHKYSQSKTDIEQNSEGKLPYAGSDDVFSSEDSDTSSCYSLEDSADSLSSSPSETPEVSESLSNLSLNVKTKAERSGTMSQKGPKSPVASGKTPHSSSQNSSRASSLQESKSSHQELPETTKARSDTPSRMSNRSTDSVSFVTDRNHGFDSPGASMRAFNRSSPSSSTFGHESPDDATQNTYMYYEPITRETSRTPDSLA